jgi:hypothetical protein
MSVIGNIVTAQKIERLEAEVQRLREALRAADEELRFLSCTREVDQSVLDTIADALDEGRRR